LRSNQDVFGFGGEKGGAGEDFDVPHRRRNKKMESPPERTGGNRIREGHVPARQSSGSRGCLHKRNARGI